MNDIITMLKDCWQGLMQTLRDLFSPITCNVCHDEKRYSCFPEYWAIDLNGNHYCPYHRPGTTLITDITKKDGKLHATVHTTFTWPNKKTTALADVEVEARTTLGLRMAAREAQRLAEEDFLRGDCAA